MEIGKRITELRERQGWTTNRLANLCGISQSFLRSVELGEKGITVDNLALVCDALSISLKDFFDVPTDSEPLQELTKVVQTLTPEQQSKLMAFIKAIR